jgi:DNA polymerase-3 subunit alpha (Gram-positive type)
MLDKKPEAEIEEIAKFYDYLEIQPIANNRFMIEKNIVASEEELYALNRRVVALGERLGIPVVATCDAHYVNDEDDIFRREKKVEPKAQEAAEKPAEETAEKKTEKK